MSSPGRWISMCAPGEGRGIKAAGPTISNSKMPTAAGGAFSSQASIVAAGTGELESAVDSIRETHSLQPRPVFLAKQVASMMQFVAQVGRYPLGTLRLRAGGGLRTHE